MNYPVKEAWTIMNKSVIKEVKSIYSNKIRTKNPVTLNAEIKSIKPEVKGSKTFFNGVIEKLKISKI